jgi:hypothetical protein
VLEENLIGRETRKAKEAWRSRDRSEGRKKRPCAIISLKCFKMLQARSQALDPDLAAERGLRFFVPSATIWFFSVDSWPDPS